MKLMKRILAMALSAALLCPVTAMAGPAEEDARVLLEQVMEQENATTDMNAFYDFNISMSGSLLEELEAEPMQMRMEMNMKASGLQDPSNLKYMTYYRVTDESGEQVTGSTYYVDGYIYNDSLGMKYKTPMDMRDAMTQALAVSEASDISMELVRDVSMYPEGQNKVIAYTMDAMKMNRYIQTFMDAIGQEYQELGLSIGSMKGEYVLNPEGLVEKVRMSMIMDMDMEGENLRIRLEGDVGIADPGQPVEVPLPNPAEYPDITLEY